MHFPRRPRIFTSRVTFLRRQHVEQMMGDPAPLACRRFRGPDIEAPVQLEGVAIDNFAAELLGQAQRQRALS